MAITTIVCANHTYIYSVQSTNFSLYHQLFGVEWLGEA